MPHARWMVSLRVRIAVRSGALPHWEPQALRRRGGRGPGQLDRHQEHPGPPASRASHQPARLTTSARRECWSGPRGTTVPRPVRNAMPRRCEGHSQAAGSSGVSSGTTTVAVGDTSAKHASARESEGGFRACVAHSRAISLRKGAAMLRLHGSSLSVKRTSAFESRGCTRRTARAMSDLTVTTASHA